MSDDKQREIDELEARLAQLKAAQRADPETPGKAIQKSDNRLLYGVAAVVGVICVVGIALSARSPNALKAAPAVTAESAPSSPPLTPEQWAEIDKRRQEAEAARLAAVTPWTYRDDVDPMTDKLTRWACTTSTNRAILDRPYKPVSADLCLRQSPRYGLHAIVQLNGSGQILCRSYDGCTLKIRFGDGAQQSFSGGSAADGSSNVVFISNATRFIAAAKSAPTTKIQLTFYQAGDQVLEFNTEKLEWPRPAK
ncbi:hypothetical protein [Brevundimonas naejangsanensis]|uniref:hypothetical protein n=1 Tax=Brevundimonas naejangsanensis TaxID=588932 RepID=UPI00041B67BC|nr:hypothetical protein [Brevundimonas naejangsanensis]